MEYSEIKTLTEERDFYKEEMAKYRGLYFTSSRKGRMYDEMSLYGRAEDRKTIFFLREKLETIEERYGKLKENGRKSDRDKIERLEEKIEGNLKIIKEQNEKIKNYEDKINHLESIIGKNSTNSAKPESSEAPYKKNIQNNREKSERKRGGQSGHQGHLRKKPERVDKEITLPTPEEYKNNKDMYFTGKYKEKFLIDIEIKPVFIKYISEIWRDRKSGKYYHTPFPSGIVNETEYGVKVKALLTLLINYGNVSINKAVGIISELTLGKINVSQGMASKLVKEFVEKYGDDEEKIKKILLSSHSLNSDSTPIRVNGECNYITVCANNKNSIFTFSKKKGFEALENTILPFFTGTIVHDHDKTYYNYGLFHQECLMHDLKYLKGALYSNPEKKWIEKMITLIKEVIKYWKDNNRNISEEYTSSINKKWDEILSTGIKEYEGKEKHEMRYEERKSYNLLLKLKDYRESELLFLIDKEVDETNNMAERDLRIIKSKMKVIGAFRSEEYAEYYSKVITFIQNTRLKNENLYQNFIDIFKRSKTIGIPTS